MGGGGNEHSRHTELKGVLLIMPYLEERALVFLDLEVVNQS
jgi:hypothetical protein